MKNSKQIIRSGIVEQFVLGLTTDAENIQVKNYIKKYPEIREHAICVRQAMEKIVQQYDIPPRRKPVETFVGGSTSSQRSWLNTLMFVLVLITLIIQITTRL